MKRTGFTGLKAWSVQRAGALCLLLFIPALLGSLLLHPIHSYSEWRAWLAQPAVSVLLLGVLAALLSHMWVGLRDVLLDYARPAGLRTGLLAILAAGLVGMAGWVVLILWRLQA